MVRGARRGRRGAGRAVFDLTPEDGGTRVDFVHAGFERAEDVSDYPFGWVWFLSRLREVATEG